MHLTILNPFIPCMYLVTIMIHSRCCVDINSFNKVPKKKSLNKIENCIQTPTHVFIFIIKSRSLDIILTMRVIQKQFPQFSQCLREVFQSVMQVRILLPQSVNCILKLIWKVHSWYKRHGQQNKTQMHWKHPSLNVEAVAHFFQSTDSCVARTCMTKSTIELMRAFRNQSNSHAPFILVSIQAVRTHCSICKYLFRLTRVKEKCESLSM